MGRFFGDRLDPYVATMATMTRSVVYGLIVTAFAQGLVAGIGYAIVGISASILLGALTGLLSVVPMVGTGVVWGSLSVYLAVTGHLWKAVILAVWGLLLVHPTDNVLRPLLISNATRVPFLLVMFGVLGGMAAFELVGAFVGPIILAMGLAAWREWAMEEES
jgi:predicted PurR-regulated permease PerM